MAAILTCKAKGQNINFSSWSNNYLQVDSYAGNTSTNAFSLSLSGNGNINVSKWKISVRLKQAVMASNGQELPANMISLQPTTTSGQAYPGPIPTITQIGAPLNVTLQLGQEVFLIPQSNASLYNSPASPNGYYELQLLYNLTIAGGAYLGKFPAWSTLFLPLEFKVYDQNNNIIGLREHSYQLQIGALSGSPPVTNQYSIQVGSGARNGLLEFKTINDYVNGVTVTYPGALVINANTSYQIRVKSVPAAFTSVTGNTLPLNTVMVQVNSTSGSMTSSSAAWLSAAFQKIATGSSSSTAVYYDIIYSTKPQDLSLIEAKMDNYTTTLQYEITPQ
ncbi:hypothetical protein [Niabella aquatica]